MLEYGAAGDTLARSVASIGCAGGLLTDHSDALGQLVECREHLFGKLVEQLVKVAKEWTEGLPVVVLVVGVENERVGHLPSQLLNDGTIRAVLASQFACCRLCLVRIGLFRCRGHMNTPVDLRE
jgi:hypothetical protein